MFGIRQISTVLNSQPIFWLFIIMETTILLGFIQTVNELVYRDVLRKLVYSLLYSGFAKSTFYYGYGVVQLRTVGPLNDVLCRICGSSLKVWRLLSFLMLLPWSLKVLEQLGDNYLRLSEALSDNKQSHVFIGIVFLLAQLIFLGLAFIFGINYIYKLNSVLRINQIRNNHVIHAYAQALNHSLGFEMIQIPRN